VSGEEAVRKSALALVSLLLLAAAADALVVARLPVDPWRLGSVLAALSLLLGAFVALTNDDWVRELRFLAQRSPAMALTPSLALLVPYAIFGVGTGTFSVPAALKLAAYVLTPSLLLLPDRLEPAQTASWRDFAALAALAVPIPAHWLQGIWEWPEELYFFLPLIAVSASLWAFVVVRGLEDVGYSLAWRRRDVTKGVANFVAFAIPALPLGYALDFIRFHAHQVPAGEFAFQFLGIYLTIAIPEELLFRGLLQNLLTKTIRRGPPGRYALIIASVIFGASHFHHAPIPNWRYCIMATLAGLLYGNAYQARGRISCSALTHTLVDTIWRFWF
jgi:CAAX protease family protein